MSRKKNKNWEGNNKYSHIEQWKICYSCHSRFIDNDNSLFFCPNDGADLGRDKIRTHRISKSEFQHIGLKVYKLQDSLKELIRSNRIYYIRYRAADKDDCPITIRKLGDYYSGFYFCPNNHSEYNNIMNNYRNLLDEIFIDIIFNTESLVNFAKYDCIVSYDKLYFDGNYDYFSGNNGICLPITSIKVPKQDDLDYIIDSILIQDLLFLLGRCDFAIKQILLRIKNPKTIRSFVIDEFSKTHKLVSLIPYNHNTPTDVLEFLGEKCISKLNKIQNESLALSLTRNHNTPTHILRKIHKISKDDTTKYWAFRNPNYCSSLEEPFFNLWKKLRFSIKL